ncbi:hypothetical protein [Halosegnis sp.]|uniref:hypothetical protein n=1 Tax=Halosegnis sp. TaxID=2864959 RepID=UPI0035D3FDD1
MNLVRTLAVNRYAVYVGGLAVIIAPAVLASAGVPVPRPVRLAVVAVALSVMTVTYLGERRLRREPTGPAETMADRPTLGTRLAVAGALAGLAAGGYLALRGRLWVGVLFVLGAGLFGRIAVGRALGGETR